MSQFWEPCLASGNATICYVSTGHFPWPEMNWGKPMLQMKMNHRWCLAGLSSHHIGAKWSAKRGGNVGNVCVFWGVLLQVNIRYSCGKPKNKPSEVYYWDHNFELCRVIVGNANSRKRAFPLGIFSVKLPGQCLQMGNRIPNLRQF